MSGRVPTLDGKVCLITGASSGLGAETAKAMAAAGAAVSLVARSSEDLQRVRGELEEHGGSVVTSALDLAEPDSCRTAVQRTADEFGRLDIVVNAAATDAPGLVADLAVEDWERVLAVNLQAPFLLSKYAWPHLREAGGGTIICVSSVAGRRGWADAAAYCSSKFGLTGLVQVLNAEGRAHGIRASVVYPGAMDTNWGQWTAEERRRTDSPAGDPEAALPPAQVADLLVWIAGAPAGLVLNETTVTPLHEQGWP